MEFSNPFDNPQGQFYIPQNPQRQFSLWSQQYSFPADWQIAYEPQSQEACQQWLDVNWTTLTPTNYVDVREAP